MREHESPGDGAMAKTLTHFPLQIFYDGHCVVCSREMELYKRRNHENRLIFIDINAPDFAADMYGRSHEEFMEKLHVRDAAGQYFTGIDAFIKIWQAFPSSPLYGFLGKTVDLPGIRLGANIGYTLFARFRYLLPKKKCPAGSCRLH